jgi:hypothetical protein
MAETLRVCVASAADNASFDVEVPADATPPELLAELVSAGHAPALPAGQSYLLAVKGGHQLDDSLGLGANGVTDGATLQLIAPTPGAGDDRFRAERLEGDHAEMGRIRCRFIEWEGHGDRPQSYLVTLNLPTYVDERRMTSHVRLRIDLGEGYPAGPPTVRVLDSPPPFHPNVFPDGRVCIGNRWDPTEGLGFFSIRIARMLLYDRPFTNPGHPANAAAAKWFVRNRDKFPLGRDIVFPDPITGATAGGRRIAIVRR